MYNHSYLYYGLYNYWKIVLLLIAFCYKRLIYSKLKLSYLESTSLGLSNDVKMFTWISFPEKLLATKMCCGRQIEKRKISEKTCFLLFCWVFLAEMDSFSASLTPVQISAPSKQNFWRYSNFNFSANLVASNTWPQKRRNISVTESRMTKKFYQSYFLNRFYP